MFNAIRISSFGGPEVLKIAKVPNFVPSMNEVVVRIHACGINPVETYIRSGTHSVKPTLPFTPGNDGAGVVEAVGDGVKSVAVGDRVYVSKSLSGTYGEKSLCHECFVHPLPSNLTYQQGAVIGIPYLTAYRAIFQRGKVQKGETMLIHGSSGSVGLAAAQLGKLMDLNIFGTASTSAGQEISLQEGCTKVFNHKKEGYIEEMKKQTPDGKGMDIILEMLANVNLEKDLNIVSPNGRIMVIGNRGTIEINPRLTMNTECDIRGVYLPKATMDELKEGHEFIQKNFESGALRAPVLREVLPLSEASIAHEMVLSPGACGKIVLDCTDHTILHA